MSRHEIFHIPINHPISRIEFVSFVFYLLKFQIPNSQFLSYILPLKSKNQDFQFISCNCSPFTYILPEISANYKDFLLIIMKK